jgi:cellulose synthase (UDP-forming)
MMELQVKPLTMLNRILLLALIAGGMLSVIWFSEFWFFSEARRDPIWFPILSIAIYWGIYRSLVNWILYYFITPLENARDLGNLAKSIRVDVLTTAMPGEPYGMFEDSLAKIQQMTYPHRTFLLDGGNDPRLKSLCESLKINHIDCTGIQGAKAGKVNYCLGHHSDAEFVFIMDPDHRPKPDLLERVLPHFKKANIGFVQVVQAYYNTEKSFVADAAAEQTFGFYGPTLMALHGLGIPTAIGANCLFRRSALDSIGGHAVHLAEDALTSMRLHAKGWQSAYLPYRGTDGLVPEDLASFFKQQYKWATGMFYLFFREYPKLFKDFPWVARIHYFNAGTFYFGGLATLMILVLPIFFLFTKQYAVEFSLGEFLFHLLPYTCSTVFTYWFLQRFYTHGKEKRVPWRSLVLEKGSWHIFVMALISGVLNRRVEYIPTPKESDHRAMPKLVTPHLVAIALSFAALVFAFSTYYRIDAGTWLMMFFAAMNILLLIPISGIALFPQFNWRNLHD